MKFLRYHLPTQTLIEALDAELIEPPVEGMVAFVSEDLHGDGTYAVTDMRTGFAVRFDGHETKEAAIQHAQECCAGRTPEQYFAAAERLLATLPPDVVDVLRKNMEDYR